MQTRIGLKLLLILILFTSCAAETVAPVPAQTKLPSPDFCYPAPTQSEYDRLLTVLKKKKKIAVSGTTFKCLENAAPAEPLCYHAKTKKEFAKLSKEQDAHPERPLVIGGKRYRCIQD
jgi:hypothetical protein